jgi:fumarate reductase subunit D
VLWQCCHRTFHALHDLKIHPPEIVRWASYGIALLAPTVIHAACPAI